MKIKLMEHQKEALEVTSDFNNVAYYYDMGLGKTFLGSEKMKEINNNNNLLICQKSKIDDWVEHFKTYYEEYEIFNLTKKKELDKYLEKSKIDDKIIGIINYDLVWRKNEFSKIKDFTMILDESSMIQSDKAKRTKFILKLNSSNVILLSGTPTGGKYETLCSQCKLLGWNISKRDYYNKYIITKSINVASSPYPIDIVTGYKNIDDLKKELRLHGAIFKKTEEVLTLPDKIENKIMINNIPEYKKFIKNDIVVINNDEIIGDTALTKLLCCRQICGMYNINKLNYLKSIIDSTLDRLIIFYNFQSECDEIIKICKEKKREVSIVNGKERDLEAYENCDNSITLIQYQAGAMGLNLQKSNKIIYYTLPLSSELFEQDRKSVV